MPVSAYNDLPPAVRDYLVSFEIMDAYDLALTASGLSVGGQAILRELVDDVLLGKITLDQLPQECGKRIPNLAVDKSKQLAVQIAGHVLLPIKQVVGDVAAAIVSWGGNMADFSSVKPIDIPEYGPQAVLSRLAKEAAVNVSDAEIPRLHFLLREYVDNTHDREATLDAFERPVKVGGLGLNPSDSSTLLDYFEAVKDTLPKDLFGAPTPATQAAPKTVAAMPPKPVVAPAPAPVVPQPPTVVTQPAPMKPAVAAAVQPVVMPVVKPSVPASPATPPSLPFERGGNGSDHLAPAESAEVAALAERAKEAAASAEPVLTGIAKYVAEVKKSVVLKDPEAYARLERIVDARLRDVRDAYGTRSELEKPMANGGVGLSGRVLADAMAKIEASVDALNAEAGAKLEQGRAELAQKREDAQKAGAILQAKQEQLMARRYAEITGKAPTAPLGATPARASVAISGEQSVADAAKRIDAGKVQQAVAAASPTPTVRAPIVRPHMEDVKRPVQRLAGPLDELRTLNLADFRRLSKDAKLATEKIMDKIELIEKEGYKERLAAVQAWKESPLNKWYVASTQEALSRGLPLEALLTEKRNAGADVPTAQELQSIVQLNVRLRF